MRRHLDEVLEAGRVLGEQREVRVGVALRGRPSRSVPAAGGDVRLVADDRVDAGLLALAVELDRPVQVAVVGDGAGVHARASWSARPAPGCGWPRRAGCSGCGSAGERTSWPVIEVGPRNDGTGHRRARPSSVTPRAGLDSHSAYRLRLPVRLVVRVGDGPQVAGQEHLDGLDRLPLGEPEPDLGRRPRWPGCSRRRRSARGAGSRRSRPAGPPGPGSASAAAAACPSRCGPSRTPSGRGPGSARGSASRTPRSSPAHAARHRPAFRDRRPWPPAARPSAGRRSLPSCRTGASTGRR